MTTAGALALFLPALLRADDQPKGDKDLDGEWEMQSIVEDGGKEMKFTGKEMKFAPIVHKVSFRGESVVLRTFWAGDLLSSSHESSPSTRLKNQRRSTFCLTQTIVTRKRSKPSTRLRTTNCEYVEQRRVKSGQPNCPPRREAGGRSRRSSASLRSEIRRHVSRKS